MLAALTFFILVVLFIAKQRIIDRGLRVAFWWTRFLPMPGPVVSGGKEGSVRGVLEDVLVEEGRKLEMSSRTTAVDTLVQTLGESLRSSLAVASASLEEMVSALPEETRTVTSILESIASSVTEQISHSVTSTSSAVLLHSEL